METREELRARIAKAGQKLALNDGPDPGHWPTEVVTFTDLLRLAGLDDINPGAVVLDFTDANLNGATFERANLSDGNFTDAYIRRAWWRNAMVNVGEIEKTACHGVSNGRYCDDRPPQRCRRRRPANHAGPSRKCQAHPRLRPSLMGKPRRIK